MAELIDHIDEIARQRCRHVAGVFFSLPEDVPIEDALAQVERVRLPIIRWLEGRGVKWQKCFDIFDGDLDPFYKGGIFVDLDVDPDEENFRALALLLEHEDGSPRLEGVFFQLVPYELALANEDFYRKSIDSV